MKNRGIPFFFLLFVLSWGTGCFAKEYDFSQYKPDPREHDHYMVYHIKPLGLKTPTYHDSVFFMASILSRTRGVIPGSSGYYMNRSKYSPDGVRLTIFLKDADSDREVSKWLAELTASNSIKVVPYVSIPHTESVFTGHYEGKELAFRKYLVLYTPITVECMQKDFKKTQSEFKSLMENGGMDIELLESSPYFMSLSYNTRSEFIRDLYFNRKWMHMVINFVLGYDED